MHRADIDTILSSKREPPSSAEAEPPKAGATASLLLSFLAPARGTDLSAEATVLRRSRSQTVCRVGVSDVDARSPEALATVALR